MAYPLTIPADKLIKWKEDVLFGRRLYQYLQSQTKEKITLNRRFGNISFSRQLYFYFMVQYTDLTGKEIIDSLSSTFNRSLIPYTKRKFEGLKTVDRKFAEIIEKHKNFIENNLLKDMIN